MSESVSTARQDDSASTDSVVVVSADILLFAIVSYTFVCSRIDYCNSPLTGLPNVRIPDLQIVLSASARLIARLPHFSHISYFMTQQLHWLPFTGCIEFKVLLLVLKSQLSSAPIHAVN